MKAKSVTIGGMRKVVLRRAEDVRYWRVYLLSHSGKVLDQSGPWDNGGAEKAFDEMVKRNTSL